jgi:hypothetical protein
MKYLLIIHDNPALMETLPKDELDAIMNAHEPFQAELKASGELVGFAALADPSNSRVVRVRDGVPAVTDGPFVEAKEYLAGFYVIDCDTPERAAEIAAKLNETKHVGIEIRPVMHEAGLEM